MMPATIYKEITIHAPAAKVWPFVGTEAGLRQWWQTDVRLDPKPGGRCAERGVFNGAPYQLEGTVAVYDPPRRLVLLFSDNPTAGAWPTAMNITITLDEGKDATVVRVVHQVYGSLITAPDRPQKEPAPSPFRPLPTILNQLPGHASPELGGDVIAPAPSIPQPVWVDQGWMHLYEARWTVRLAELSQRVTEKGTSS